MMRGPGRVKPHDPTREGSEWRIFAEMTFVAGTGSNSKLYPKTHAIADGHQKPKAKSALRQSNNPLPF